MVHCPGKPDPAALNISQGAAWAAQIQRYDMKAKSILSLLLALTAGLTGAAAAFVELDNFNRLTYGPLGGRNGWVATQTAFVVTNDPGGGPNTVLAAPAMAESPIYKPLGALTLTNNRTGTLFFRMRRAAAALNVSVGASDLAAPTTGFADFEAQINCNTTGANNLNVRDAGVFDPVDSFNADAWYRIWMVIDNAADLTRVYMQGGQYGSQTLLDGNTDGETAFTFRNSTGDGFNSNTGPVANNLISFLVRIGGSHTGPFYLDDVYVDNTGENLSDPTVDTTPPVVAEVQPASGSTVYAFTSLTVRFSEPVAGVAPGDLLINGVAATGVSGGPETWVFTFPAPSPGDVSVFWNFVLGITDFSANPFDGADTWNYTYVLDVTPPVISAVSPAPSATINTWPQTQIVVTFDEPVSGVSAADLLVNGTPALTVTNLGNSYFFTAAQPAPGGVSVAFASGHGITDAFSNPFDETLPAHSWTYTFTDTAPPLVSTISPPPGTLVVGLNAVEVTFNEAVTDVDPTDLLVNGAAATGVTGSGAGPYRFTFPAPAAGPIQFAWAATHDITDGSANPFAGGNWNNLQAAVRPSGFVLFEDFNALTPGPLNGQNYWVASNDVVVAVDPTEAQNQVASIANSITADAYRRLDAVTLTNGTVGTVFWRFRRADSQLNISHGLADAAPPPPRDFGSFEVQLQSNGTNPPALNARDAGAFRQVAEFTPDAWFSVWAVVDNALDLTSFYLQGGGFATQTLLTSLTNASEFAYTFRNTGGDGLNSNTGPVASNLVYFLLRASGNSNHVGPFLLDDIYVDYTGANLSNPLPPAKPTGLAATPGPLQASLTWNAVPDATGYVVKRATVAGGPYTRIATNATTSFTDTGLDANATYYYVVSALGANGESLNSDPVTVSLNRPPVAGNTTWSTTRSTPVSVSAAALLALCSDPDLDPLSLASVGNSTNGAAVTLVANIVTYAPVTGFIGVDRFTFTVSDGRGGTADGFVFVDVYPGDVAGVNFVSFGVGAGGNFQCAFTGIPGRTYGLERALQVTGPWTNLTSVVAAPDGLTSFTDANSPAGQAFYRTVYPAP